MSDAARTMTRLLVLAWFSLAIAAPVLRAAEPVDYQKHIKPILAERCFKCHGAKEPEAGLRLDTAGGPLTGGSSGPAIVPGKSNESLLVHAISREGDATPMPPEDEGEPLSSSQIALIKTWIDEGAAGAVEPKPGPPTTSPREVRVAKSDHWSFQPIRNPEPPAVGGSLWVRNAVDRFVLSRLQQAGIAPSPEADRATLLRRVSLDLTGLPPLRAELEAFLGDESAGAYEKVVDRLLRSPHYGERMARNWLDVARYADSNGFTIDSARTMWLYRDWVIKAFNQDKPFDQFVIEQLAGDLLPNPTTEQLVATGFHRNTLVNEEGGVDPEQFRIEAVNDRVSTTGTAFLGLTVGCAQCHSHKFDPISHKEYYEFFAFFNTADEPSVSFPSAQQSAELKGVRQKIADDEGRIKAYEQAIQAGQVEWERRLAAELPVNWLPLDAPEVASARSATLEIQEDGSYLATGNKPATDEYQVRGYARDRVTAIRLDFLLHDSLPSSGPGRGEDGSLVLSEVGLTQAASAEAGQTNARAVAWADAVADNATKGSPIEHAIDGKAETGFSPPTRLGIATESHWAFFVTKDDVSQGAFLRLRLAQDYQRHVRTIGRFQVRTTDASREVLALRESSRTMLLRAADKRTAAENQQLRAEYLKWHATFGPIYAEIEQLKAREQDILSEVPSALVMKEPTRQRESFVHVRGDFLRKGMRVEPHMPAVLPTPADASKRLTRLDLAKWLVNGRNPLTARVAVNRFWQHFFGVGLVETENDFGKQGSPPSHPELLDSLAWRFMAEGWSVKSLTRLIVTSSTYRQSSHARNDLAQTDPRNRLLARQARLRLDAEAIRDAALSASGLLSPKIGGPSVFPPQPKGFYRFTQSEKTWPESEGPDRYRRGLYTWFWRSAPDPFLITFDAPGGNVTCTRRNRSNTPLQALTLANDQALFEIAQGLAALVLREGGADDLSRIGFASELCLARKPTAKEQEVLLRFVRSQAQDFELSPDDAKVAAPHERPANISLATAAAWTAVARVFLNLDEFITRE